jgi:YtxH-like protein
MADINAETILKAVGLQRQDSSGVAAPVVGAFIVGGLIGAGIALLFAPKASQDLRRDLGQRVDEALESKEDLVSEYKKPGKDEYKKNGLSASPGAIPPPARTTF